MLLVKFELESIYRSSTRLLVHFSLLLKLTTSLQASNNIFDLNWLLLCPAQCESQLLHMAYHWIVSRDEWNVRCGLLLKSQPACKSVGISDDTKCGRDCGLACRHGIVLTWLRILHTHQYRKLPCARADFEDGLADLWCTTTRCAVYVLESSTN